MFIIRSHDLDFPVGIMLLIAIIPIVIMDKIVIFSSCMEDTEKKKLNQECKAPPMVAS